MISLCVIATILGFGEKLNEHMQSIRLALECVYQLKILIIIKLRKINFNFKFVH